MKVIIIPIGVIVSVENHTLWFYPIIAVHTLTTLCGIFMNAEWMHDVDEIYFV